MVKVLIIVGLFVGSGCSTLQKRENGCHFVTDKMGNLYQRICVREGFKDVREVSEPQLRCPGAMLSHHEGQPICLKRVENGG